ncbi:dienelactone hydrolase family protein [Limibaculum sp. M0105]|uniref:Dienelactone hydrolase family protein n=1 Tax=Thermohalobaculum xanthum TaxID=2753746 RepID=A0A8J7SBI2_9RHOB|nr:dienelactone hydrolase family protein [Thermohalobaculum xanthum]MBK0398353.1 dienelactone hydrolase family protein [Thermohalobaculum xanthum]
MTIAEPALTGPRHAPSSGQTKSLVILLHGYGADGNDLIGLAEPLSQYMPDTAFRAPNAPDRCSVNPMGYQWFPISWIDGSPESEMKAGFLRAAGILDAYITTAMAEEGVGPHETALVGFSQGTMMSLHVAPRREVSLAGVVGFSGRLNAPERIEAEARVKPPVLLIHGDMDEVIPVAALGEAHDALADAGFPVAAHVSRGVGHGIAPDGLGLALGFLMDRFGIERPVGA